MRSRNITFHPDFFPRDAGGSLGDLGGSDGSTSERIVLELFGNRRVRALRERIEPAPAGGTILVYSLVDELAPSHLILSIVGDSVSGTLRLKEGLFKIQAIGDGLHTLLQIDEQLRMPCSAGPSPRSAARQSLVDPPADRPADLRSGLSAQPSSGPPFAPPAPFGGGASGDTTADVMVVYTDNARSTHSKAGIESLINLAVFEANETLANSDADLRINLVHTAEVAFNEGNGQLFLNSFLHQLSLPDDGIIDQVHEWRDEYDADCVSMIVDSAIGCGAAWLMEDLSVTFAEDAFSVCKDNCVTGEMVFIHELGHTFGCGHDQGNGQAGIFPYSRGYRTPSSEYRTVMAYSPGVRLPYFSNPDHTAPNGEALGVPETETFPANNQQSINLAASTIAAFRISDDVGKRLTTHYLGGNGSGGAMFDLQPRTDLDITGMNINTTVGVGTPVQINVWYRAGTYVGHEDSSTGWKYLTLGGGSSAGDGNPTFIDLDSLANAKTFRADRTYGIYVDLANFPAGILRYTNGGPTPYENNDLRIITGVGKGGDFGADTFSYREWNGTLFYRGGDGKRTLTTTFASNNASAGNMFDVQTKRNIRVHSLDVNVSSTANVIVDVWYREGTYADAPFDISAWTFVGTDGLAYGSGIDSPTRISIPPLDLDKNKTYGFYVYLATYDSSSTLRYSNGGDLFEDSHLKLTTGVGRGEGAFTGTVFNDRTWNGAIHYTRRGFLAQFVPQW
ncbi:MAG: hypothetical protein ACI8QZ_001371 [Chlamydiales bacterium]